MILYKNIFVLTKWKEKSFWKTDENPFLSKHGKKKFINNFVI